MRRRRRASTSRRSSSRVAPCPQASALQWARSTRRRPWPTGAGAPKRCIRRDSISASRSGIRRHHRPRERGRRRAVDLRRRHLLHAAMRQIDLDGAGLDAALDARAELVALVGRVEEVDVLADRPAHRIHRDLGAVLGPVGFHHADRRLLDRDDEAEVVPELAHRRPGLLGRGLDDEPALGAGAHDARVGILRQQVGLLRSARLLGRKTARRGRAEAVVEARRVQVRRDLERRRRARRLVVDALAKARRAPPNVSQPASAVATRAVAHSCGNAPKTIEKIRSIHRVSVHHERQPASRSAERSVSLNCEDKRNERQPQLVADLPHLGQRPLDRDRVRLDEQPAMQRQQAVVDRARRRELAGQRRTAHLRHQARRDVRGDRDHAVRRPSGSAAAP